MASTLNTGRLSPEGHPGSVSTVAVIGGGISGVTAAAHLLKQGLQVKLFERSNIAGGIWHFDPRAPDSPSYPSLTPSIGEYRTTKAAQFDLNAPPTPPLDATDSLKLPHPLSGGDFTALEISFSPPGPCYAGLKNNVPTEIMVTSLGPWPEETASHVSQQQIELYVQALAQDNGVNEIAEYNTRVEEVKKSPDSKTWVLRVLKLTHQDGKPQFQEKTIQADAVVVATGHYSLPYVPDIPGLKQWKEAFGSRVIHSKQYRTPAPFKDQSVFVLGCGVSAMDISRELGHVANKVYQSSRGGPYDLPATLLPDMARRVGAVASFEFGDDTSRDGKPAKGTVVLQDGERIEGIDSLIVATGYITSYPFLADLHDDHIDAKDAGPRLLVSAEGTMTHNLHKDIFYIEDPTLTFVGVPFHNITFNLFDYQSQVVARVLAGKASLPPREKMRAEYEKRIQDKGLGREFHSLNGELAEEDYVKELVAWINQDADRDGYDRMQGHSVEWIDFQRALKKRFKAIVSGEISSWPGAS